MRIKRNRLRQYHHRTATPKKDKEGSSYLEYDPASSFMAELWPAGGKVQAEIYGQRLAYIRNCRIDGAYTVIAPEKQGEPASYHLESGAIIRENDGICINSDADAAPDYRVIAIKPYRHLFLEMEQI